MNVGESPSQTLLDLHSQIVEELRKRGILRTSNNPVGDLAEYLFCKAYGWEREVNSRSGFDVISPDGIRYQIKARRCAPQDKLRQLSAIRKLDEADFDFLVGVIFSIDYKVQRAALIPYAVVKEHAKGDSHTNSHRFLLRDDVWKMSGVKDITEELKAVKLS
jgi:hypothetical protein